MPFIPFPYIRMKANDCPGVAFLRTSCATSLIAESFALKANLLCNINRSDCQTIYVPISGGAKVLGWIDDVQVRIDELNLQFVYRLGVVSAKHLPVFAPKKFDILIATDLMCDLGLGMDIGKLVITRKGKMAKFLTEDEQLEIEFHREDD